MGTVDPQAQALLDAWAAAPATPVAQLTPRLVRASDRAVEALQPPQEPVRHIEEHMARTGAGQVAVRVYTPLEGSPPWPMLIYFHGGGFVIGSESYQSPLHALANRTRHLLCAVEYRLAPEHRFPAAVEDAFDATAWLVEHAPRLGGDPRHVVIGGDSSGGNLAAVVTLLNREQQAFELQFQALIYPMLDASCSQPSTHEFATGYGFSREKIGWYFDQYLPPHVDRRDPRISPLFAATVEGLPPAFIASAEFDPLRDEAELYAQRLRDAGVPVTLKRYPGMIHGFFQMTGVLDQGQALIDDLGAALRQLAAGRSY